MDELFIFFTFVSIATERLVELAKGIVPFLNEKHADPTSEERRSLALKLLASVFGIIIVFSIQTLSNEVLPEGWNSPLALIIIALVASGGAAGWHRMLKIKKQANESTVKDLGIT